MVEARRRSQKATDWLRGRGLTDDMIEEAELGYVEGGRYRDSIAIPYTDAQGRYRYVRYRHLRPNPPAKYESPKGGGKHLYNVAATATADIIVITEGEFDSLIVRQLGIPAVAVTGTSGWERDWRWLFRDCDMVLVAMDRAVPDENPDAAAAEDKTRARILAQVGMVTIAEPVELPVGLDITDWYLQDPQALKEALS
jgi:DNA primase